MQKNKINVIGKGFLAKELEKVKFGHAEDFVIYAAGISNSKIKNLVELKREIDKIKACLKNFDKDKVLVYISTLSVLQKKDNKNLYIKNKKKIELLIRKNLKNYIILRFPQIVGKNINPHTLTNFLYRKIKNNKNFVIWSKTKRNLIDIIDMKKIVKEILINRNFKNKIFNIKNNESIYVEQIVDILSEILQKKPKFSILKLRDTHLKNSIYKKTKNKYLINIFKKKNYSETVLRRYYK